MLDIRRLRLLRELSVRGTLAEVAEALHQSPSSVSQQLTQLEREVGVPLLRKVGRRVQLTAAAHVLVEHTGVILARLEQAESEVLALGDATAGTVRMAVFQSAALAFMPQTLAALTRDHPNLHVTMTQRAPEQALHGVSLREFDLVVAEEYPGHAAPWYDGLDRIPLTTDALALAVPPEGEPWDSITSVADAAGVPWVMEPPGAESRHWAEQVCRQAGFEPEVRYETDDLQAHVALIEEGNAVAVLPGLMTVRHRPDVRMLALPGTPRRTVFTATRTAITDTPAVAACRAALAEVAQRFPESDRLGRLDSFPG
ncbi:LysR family transcriptional regulator [Nocardioides insulae]|uniref:LysR family transcriptional regulator n=1 Tax=Nocardioides insulae TaxID=394734 RepID=UPI00041B9C79|nr:LysR family transcriptional regulator [Nocardioides insulae]